MTLKHICVMAVVVCFTACQKNYTCECRNPGGVYATYDLNNMTKEKAGEKCAAYNNEAQKVPMSESHCFLK